MNQTPTFVGIDVSKAHLDVASRPDGRAFRLPNSAEGVAAFLEKREPAWTLAPSKDLPDWFPWRPEPPFTE